MEASATPPGPEAKAKASPASAKTLRFCVSANTGRLWLYTHSEPPEPLHVNLVIEHLLFGRVGARHDGGWGLLSPARRAPASSRVTMVLLLLPYCAGDGTDLPDILQDPAKKAEVISFAKVSASPSAGLLRLRCLLETSHIALVALDRPGGSCVPLSRANFQTRCVCVWV